jgi:hypothetical protein
MTMVLVFLAPMSIPAVIILLKPLFEQLEGIFSMGKRRLKPNLNESIVPVLVAQPFAV